MKQGSRPDLLDGEWHHLHPITPLLRGGLAFVAIIGILIANFRELIFAELFPLPGDEWNIWRMPTEVLLIAIGAIVLILLLAVVSFYLSWKFSTFRVTDELIELKTGVVFKSHRRARLDRIQGINVQRPLIPRIFGTARLDISGAGEDASIALSYLASADADQLRRALLTRASGEREETETAEREQQWQQPENGSEAQNGWPQSGPSAEQIAAAQQAQQFGIAPQPGKNQYWEPPRRGGGLPYPAGVPAGGNILDRRVAEFTAEEYDDFTPANSLVRIPISRIIGSLVFNIGTVIFVLVILALVSGVFLLGDIRFIGGLLFAFIPGLIGLAGYLFSQITRAAQYSIAQTKHGVRVGYGLFSLTNETIPPRRIHAVEVYQPLLWRAFGWWRVRITRASASTRDGAAGQENNVILPVGTRADALTVLDILMPDLELQQRLELVESGLSGNGQNTGYQLAPRRAIWFLPISWHRHGWQLDEKAVYLRHGVLSRKLSLIPFARIQSVTWYQGPFARGLRLGGVRFDLVAGAVTNGINNLAEESSAELFRRARQQAVVTAKQEYSERWAEQGGSGPDTASEPGNESENSEVTGQSGEQQ